MKEPDVLFSGQWWDGEKILFSFSTAPVDDLVRIKHQSLGETNNTICLTLISVQNNEFIQYINNLLPGCPPAREVPAAPCGQHTSVLRRYAWREQRI